MVDRMADRRYGSPPRYVGAAGGKIPSGALYSADPEPGRTKAPAAAFDAVRISMSSAVSSSSQGSCQEDEAAAGDLFMWGEGTGDGVLGGGLKQVSGSHSNSSTTDAFSPRAVQSLVALDVHTIACGVRHAALVTRQGEVFTWGEEGGGRLGHGLDADVPHPQLLDSLASLNVVHVCCGEYHSCAVSQAGDLYTWGDGTHNFGLLGHGNRISHWTPKQVSGALEGVRVVSVACGPWHTVLVTSAGQLFSFGDGTFGVLGHGDRSSLASPREVESLRGLKTVRAACGPWHTAAVVEVMVGYSNSSCSLSGKLFSWGDGDKNRLGHGDKEQKLVPTCVAALVDHNFRQVACGHSLTVALTTTGHVYTMGSPAYGQLGDPQATGKLPAVLRLGKVFVEEVCCGAYHVAALSAKGEVYTWGKGANGRLGHGDADDRSTPVLIEALKDRQVKKVACGSSFTAAICLHKSVPGSGNPICSGCRQPFGFTRKKHSCYNCGFAYCHSCSSKKALYAALAPSPRKPHRVCDTCFLKLSSVGLPIAKENADAKLTKVQLKEFSVKATKRGKRPDSSSRVSPMPSLLLQWGGVNAPATFNTVLEPPETAKSNPQSRVGSRAVSPLSRRPATPRSATPTPTIAGLTSPRREVEEVKRINESLVLEISRLKAQVEKLTRRCESHEKELVHSARQMQEAFAVAGAETAKCKAAKEVIMSLTAQLKDLAERMPPGTYRAVRPEAQMNGLHVEDGRGKAAVLCEVPARLSDVEASRVYQTEGNNNGRSSVSAPTDVGPGLEEWVEQDQPGVYITLTALPGGGKDLKRVRFSRKRFSEKQAETWWQENRQRVYEQYNVRAKASVSAVSSRAKESS